MCEGNCKCKDKEIKTEWVETEIGQQLKFAVPEDGLNAGSMNVVDEIKNEIMNYLTILHKSLSDKKSGDPIDDGYISHRLSTLSDVEYEIKKIFEKY